MEYDGVKKMKSLYKSITHFLIFVSLSYVTTAYAINTHSPIGDWKTIDDATGQVKSIVQIYSTSNQTLSGKVIKIFPKAGEDQNKICDACKGNKHNQKIVGMVIMENMKAKGDEWDDGQIMDPKNGKTYRCQFKLIDNGSKLKVRGYIGISAFGRSQVWERVELSHSQ